MFVTDKVTDISPVRALVRLAFFQLCWRPGASRQGKTIRSFAASRNETGDPALRCHKCVDLSPLHEIPLTILNCSYARVSDLSPLQGMQLTELDCGRTQVHDLSPLQGMKMKYLQFYNTSVSDLSSLKGMPLGTVRCAETLVSEPRRSKGCDTLRTLQLQGTKVTAAGVAALQKALPDCKIEWDGSTSASPVGEGAARSRPGLPQRARSSRRNGAGVSSTQPYSRTLPIKGPILNRMTAASEIAIPFSAPPKRAGKSDVKRRSRLGVVLAKIAGLAVLRREPFTRMYGRTVQVLNCPGASHLNRF